MNGLAALPMYDWPAAQAANDRLWKRVRDRLRRLGVPAPDALDRSVELSAGWTDPGLVLGQTCGLPIVQALAGRVCVVGAADHALPGCRPGWYRSAIVVRKDDPRQSVEAFRGATLAANARDSQSGWGSILHRIAGFRDARRFFGAVEFTGAHVASAACVADLGADLAAIDLVTWRQWLRHGPPAARLRVLELTEPTPGLPFITAMPDAVPALRQALAAAIAAMSPEDRATLGMVRLVPLDAGDYALVRERYDAAVAEAG